MPTLKNLLLTAGTLIILIGGSMCFAVYEDSLPADPVIDIVDRDLQIKEDTEYIKSL